MNARAEISSVEVSAADPVVLTSRPSRAPSTTSATSASTRFGAAPTADRDRGPGRSRPSRAGLKKGDVIVSVAGQEVRGSRGHPRRSSWPPSTSAAPGTVRGRVPAGRKDRRRRRSRRGGIPTVRGRSAFRSTRGPEGDHERFPARTGVRRGMAAGAYGLPQTLAVLGRLFRRHGERQDDVRARSTSRSSPARRRGPARSRWSALMAAISLQLGIFNLLPIPVLDGGHLFLLTLEGIVRRDFSLQASRSASSRWDSS